ncbi:hypothetical protein KC957_01670 [Candidatus Saccharibacteria bacterium]|nr:hypothetical protein [Candidatus Saccharibacteria bacterium]
MASQDYDYSAFSRRFTALEIYQHFRLYGSMAALKLIGVGSIVLMTALAVLWMGVGLTTGIRSATGEHIALWQSIATWCLGIGTVGFVVWASVRSIARAVTTSLRLKAFAESNGLGFSEETRQGENPGLIFQYGDSHRIVRGLTLNDQAGTIIANYRYMTGSGKSRQAHYHGFVRITLSRQLPQVLLDAVSNNFLGKISNFADVDNNQRIDLEGDFNNYFQAYAPVDYGPDTLYWLTPELMQLLIQYLGEYDIEVVDNYVYLYRGGEFTFDEATTRNLIGLGQWLYAEFEQNTRRYSDERVGSFAANAVAKPGRRLKRSIGWWFVIFWIIYFVVRIVLIFRD